MCDRDEVKALLIVAAMSASAAADSGHWTSWDELGVLRARVDVGDGYTVTGEAVRFAPHVPIGQNVYIGAELDTGTISGRVPSGQTYRTTGGEQQPTAMATGKFGAVRAIIGVRMRFGILSAAGELAAGMHAADLEDAYGQQVAAVRADSTELEGRARIDLWITPRLTVGAIAGVGLDDSRDATAGLMFGYHFGNYDGMR